jgi:hypothetical protein
VSSAFREDMSAVDTSRDLVRGRGRLGQYHARAMADETQIPLDAQLEEIGAQLDWVRGYL